MKTAASVYLVLLVAVVVFLLVDWRSPGERAAASIVARPRPEAQAPGDTPPSLATRAWKVESLQGFGSGFPVCSVGDRWYFVTAAHVAAPADLPDDRPTLVHDQWGRTLPVLAFRFDRDVDCAVLLVQGDGRPVDCLRLSDRPIRDGDPVWLGAYPQGVDLYVTSGTAVRTALHQNVSCPAEPGSSGGPVLGADGRVVGILTRVWMDAESPFGAHRVSFMAVAQPAVSFLDFVGKSVSDLSAVR